MPRNLRNINCQVSSTMSQARMLLRQLAAHKVPDDINSVFEGAGQLVTELRELVATVKVAGITVHGPLGSRHIELGDHTEGSGLLDMITNLFKDEEEDDG